MALFNGFSGSVLVDAFLALLTLYFWLSYRSYSRLSHIPGPRLWGWTVFPLFMVHLRGQIYEVLGELSAKYGPLVRIAPNTLLISDPDELRKMNAARSPYTRAPWYVAFRMIPGVDNVFSVRDEDVHADRRRKMAAGYSGKENSSLESDIDSCVHDLINLLETKYLSSPPHAIVKMDLARKFQFFTNDVISKLAFDENFNDLKDDHDNHGYIEEVETIFPNFLAVSTIPSFTYAFTAVGLAKLFAPSVESKLGLGKVLAITKAQVGKRIDAEGKKKVERRDMISSFLRHGLTRSEAEQEAVLQLVAGTDTVATSLRSTFLCIISNPRVHARLRAEIDNAVKASKNNLDGNDNIIGDAQARQLPYLQACIKEGIRWYPAIAGLLSKYTPPEGDVLCGFPVPGNVSIGQSAYAIHHSKALFGPDETVFRPERWIPTSQGGDEPSIEKISVMERNNDMVFGNGRYQCLGKPIAAIEMNKVVFELIKRFDISLDNTLQPWKSTCYAIHLQSDFWVTVRKRE